MSQTEVRPVREGCRHLRARYKVEHRGRSGLPERELLRYECQQGFDVEAEEAVDKCMESHANCWQKTE